MGFITGYVTVCVNLGPPGSCVTEYVTDLHAYREIELGPLSFLEDQGLELPDWQP
jgi:hypothetical protein